MEHFIFVLEVIGLISFASSGALTAIRKNMDLFGVITLGLITSVGGGVIRDLILGITPPKTFQNPIYAIIAVVISLFMFILYSTTKRPHGHRMYDIFLLLADSLGLGAFSMVGITVALDATYNNPFLLVFVGVITGVGGGVLRDVLAGNTPYIFVKHVYACASLIGSILCVTLYGYIGETAAVLLGMATVVIIRLLSAHYKWNLPHPRFTDEAEDEKTENHN